VQWRQVVSGAFIDNHPAFETMLLWLVTRIWQTPSMMAIFQIFALSLVMAWGLGELLRLGTPKWAVWGLSVLMGVSVLNGFMAAAIWKDTPYAIAVMGFTVLLLKIVTTNGKFLESGITWFWLGAVGALMPLFRHNGIALPIATLPVLLIAYRRYWKPILASIVCFVCLWLGVRGPLYDLLNVDKTQSVGDYFIIHHIGAYVDAGVPLTTEQTNFLSALRPLDQWNYNCCTVNTIIFESFNVNFLNANPGKPIGILLDLIKQDPAIDLRHFMCVSSPYWNINPVCPPLMGNWSSNYKRNLSWVDPNEFGFKEQSMFPVLANLIGGWIVSDKITILWEPAPYLYLLLILIVVIMFRTRNVRYLLVWLPTVVQTAVIIVLSMVPQTRYQFSTALVAVWSVGMLFLTRTQANKDS
jgi:hypothetical protein